MPPPFCQTLERSGATLCDETLVFREIRRPTSGNEYRSRVAFSFERFDTIFTLSRALCMGEGEAAKRETRCLKP